MFSPFFGEVRGVGYPIHVLFGMAVHTAAVKYGRTAAVQ